MIRTWLLFVCLLLAFGANAQRKIVFRDGVKRAVIKPGKEIGVTKTGEAYYYRNWKNICSGCYLEGCIDSTYNRKLYWDSLYYYDRACGDSACYANRWVLDSVEQNYIVLRRFSADSTKYRFDTVDINRVGKYYKSMKKSTDYYYIDMLPYEDSVTDNSLLIFAVVIDYDRLKIPIDSIASFTFPEASTCSTFDLGTPLMALAGVIGGPIAASQEPKFSWSVLIGFETIGIYLTVAMITNIRELKVREYRTSDWIVKVK